MKESVLMKIIVGVLLAIFLSFTGCGSGSDPIFKDGKVADINETATDPKDKDKNETVTDAEDKNETAKKYRNYCGYVKNIGAIQGVKVGAYDDKGVLMIYSKDTDSSGRYCFFLPEEPASIKVDASGGSEILSSYASYTTNCNGDVFHSFVENSSVECQPIVLNINSDLNMTKAKLLRSYLGHAYENMGVAFSEYNQKILDALAKASDLDGIFILLDGVSGINAKQKDIIKHVVRIVEDVNDDTITTAIVALDIVTKIDGGTLKNGDNDVTKWIDENRYIVEDYLTKYPKSDIRSLSLRLVQKIEDGSLAGVNSLVGLEGVIIPLDVAKCDLSSTRIDVCMPSLDLVLFKATYDKTGLDLTDISSLRTEYQKKAGVAEFKVFEEHVRFSKAILTGNNINRQFDLISNNKDNIFTTRFTPNITKAGVENKKFLLVLVYEFFENNDEKEKSEHITMAFSVDANVSSDDNLTLYVPANTEIFFYSKIKNGTVYDKVALSINNSRKRSLNLADGGISIDSLSYFDTIFERMNDNNRIAKMKKFIVEHLSNNGGVPGVFIKNVALIDASVSPVKNFIKNGADISKLSFGLSNSINTYKSKMPSTLKVVRVKSYFKE